MASMYVPKFLTLVRRRATILHADAKFGDSMERTVVRCAERHVFSTVSMTSFINDSVEKVVGFIRQMKRLLSEGNTF
ncbi:hypothetical protein [Streptomyces sp. NPDC001020]